MHQAIGYEFLRLRYADKALPHIPAARVAAVTRVTSEGDALLVPATVAPKADDLLEHLLFALKHEGTHLAILAQALPQIGAEPLLAALAAAPSSSYVRVLCFLWEHWTGHTLPVAAVAKNTATALVFDPKRYVTRRQDRDARWHVSFNGLGTLAYCATVRRTQVIEAGMAQATLAQTEAFAAALPKPALDRALQWAYLHETESSFAIEHEAPTQQRAQAFVQLLQQAHEPNELTEQQLVALQNAVISNPHLHAVGYRTEQNWLRGPGRGALGVSYVPPPPDLAEELMAQLLLLARDLPRSIDPIVAASICSFGFVYIHPFMDGNGRLSRFLFHRALCQSGQLASGLILPVSVAMQRREMDYLACLQTFSKPARMFWQVTWIDEGQYALQWQGHDSLYRYWDATACAEFGLAMAHEALEVELQQESEFLARYDAVYAAVNAQFDLHNNDLATLVLSVLGNQGVVSNNRRKQFALRVPEAAFKLLEQVAQAHSAEV
ncbi:MAG: Fic family protein [Burkholderiaceae bacterium]